MQEKDENLRKKETFGKVFLVGAGPGNPDLITVRGIRVLEKADVVMYDHLVSPELLAHAKKGAELIYLGKEAGAHTLTQDKMNRLIVKKAKAGLSVVRLKGGDPFVFGRGGEEAETLAAEDIKFEIVPGITSGIAGPAYAGIPVTFRKIASSVALITGHEDPTKFDSSIHWEHLAKGVDTLVFYMGVGNLPAITAKLMEHGRPASTPVALVRWGTLPKQRTVTGTLATIVEVVKKAALKPPCIIVVGGVVNVRKKLNWFEKLPLFGKRIINTRSRAQSSELSVLLRALGAEVLELPTIETVPEGVKSPLAAELKRLDGYDWILFTSPNGVRSFFDLLLALRGDVRALGNAKIGSIGDGTTREIERYKIRPTVTATEAVAEGLIKALKRFGPWKGVRVLLARADKARDILPDTLRKWGADLTVRTAYRTIKPAGLDKGVVEALRKGEYDLITFSSSSTFENLVELTDPGLFRGIKRRLKAASIGPITTSALIKQGVRPKIEARDHTIPGLAGAIKEYLS